MGLVDWSPRPTPLWIIAIVPVVASLHWMQVLALPMAFALFQYRRYKFAVRRWI